ncbi:hypothetical protein BV898_18469 [Hypsibius exemplaris]|uniref:Uncharacterized protein n=1 Tax=Hypsibius exemplaris TaxID=2072580 RepID=A0A9X6NHT3_HYPEX|nr:hypothetical protein BV898_18469 [Hypsibius exemplaris]
MIMWGDTFIGGIAVSRPAHHGQFDVNEEEAVRPVGADVQIAEKFWSVLRYALVRESVICEAYGTNLEHAAYRAPAANRNDQCSLVPLRTAPGRCANEHLLLPSPRENFEG